MKFILYSIRKILRLWIIRLIFFAFTPALLAAQLTVNPTKDSLGVIEKMPLSGTKALGGKIHFGSDYDCVPNIRWDTIIQNIDTLCIHSWVYAKHDDVNSDYHYLGYNQARMSLCPTEKVENFARICKICYQHECFVKTLSFEMVIKKSQYKILLDESQKNSFKDRKE